MSKFLLPVGPYHPALHEPEYFHVVVDGETIVDLDFSLGYNYREIEKQIVERNWSEALFLVERVCGICAHHHSLPFVNNVEKISGVEVPLRAKYIRTILAELARLHSHLLWFGLAADAIGFETLFMLFWKEREIVMNLIEEITGNRVHYSINTFSGVKKDLTPKLIEKIKKDMKLLKSGIQKPVEIFRTDKLIEKRFLGVGPLKKIEAIKLGAVGPVARASGVKIDVRRDNPYEAYEEINFKVITESGGDCMARGLVRAAEIFESIYMIEQLVDKLPSGELKTVKFFSNAPVGKESVFTVEAPRGENFHYCISGGEKPAFLRIRVPTYANIFCTLPMLKDHEIADIPAVIASIDPCFACLDRICVVNERGEWYRLDT